jgi:Tol biopolymer transport system component
MPSAPWQQGHQPQAAASTPISTTRVSVSSTGGQGNGSSGNNSDRETWMTAAGGAVVFSSSASNLVSGDTNNAMDVFVHDRSTLETQRVSVSSAGAQGNGVSAQGAISADGRYVAFYSDASNLVSGDTNARSDVFVRDIQTGTTTRVSVSSSGAQANGNSSQPHISADGRFVAFTSDASDLVSGDTNARRDVFLHDRSTGTTSRVSVRSTGAQTTGTSQFPFISGDGRYIAYSSADQGIVPGDTNSPAYDVFRYDRTTGAVIRVSVGTGGTQGNDHSSSNFHASLSYDGSVVAFESVATNLIAGDTNVKADIFVRDISADTTTRVSVSSAGAQGDNKSGYASPTMSYDGRFVAFDSSAGNLVANDTYAGRDVFVHDRQTATTELVSKSSTGVQGELGGDDANISGDGRYVAFSINLLQPHSWRHQRHLRHLCLRPRRGQGGRGRGTDHWV